MKRFSGIDLPPLFLEPGQLFVDLRPALVETILGSCVAVTMFCRQGRFGGICHALLPDGPPEQPGHHLTGAVPLLLEQMLRLGSNRACLEIKLFGGGNVLGISTPERPGIGEQNAACAMALLRRLDLPIMASDTGGRQGRRLYFNSGTGEVFVRTMRKRQPATATMA